MRFESAERGNVMKEYRERLAAQGKKIRVITPCEEYFATLLTVDDDGALVVKDENGDEKRLISGEISIKL